MKDSTLPILTGWILEFCEEWELFQKKPSIFDFLFTKWIDFFIFLKRSYTSFFSLGDLIKGSNIRLLFTVFLSIIGFLLTFLIDGGNHLPSYLNSCLGFLGKLAAAIFYYQMTNGDNVVRDPAYYLLSGTSLLLPLLRQWINYDSRINDLSFWILLILKNLLLKTSEVNANVRLSINWLSIWAALAIIVLNNYFRNKFFLLPVLNGASGGSEYNKAFLQKNTNYVATGNILMFEFRSRIKTITRDTFFFQNFPSTKCSKEKVSLLYIQGLISFWFKQEVLNLGHPNATILMKIKYFMEISNLIFQLPNSYSTLSKEKVEPLTDEELNDFQEFDLIDGTMWEQLRKKYSLRFKTRYPGNKLYSSKNIDSTTLPSLIKLWTKIYSLFKKMLLVENCGLEEFYSMTQENWKRINRLYQNIDLNVRDLDNFTLDIKIFCLNAAFDFIKSLNFNFLSLGIQTEEIFSNLISQLNFNLLESYLNQSSNSHSNLLNFIEEPVSDHISLYNFPYIAGDHQLLRKFTVDSDLTPLRWEEFLKGKLKGDENLDYSNPILDFCRNIGEYKMINKKGMTFNKITKVFTSLLVTQQGKKDYFLSSLNLDKSRNSNTVDNLERFSNMKKITFRHFSSHESGANLLRRICYEYRHYLLSLKNHSSKLIELALLASDIEDRIWSSDNRSLVVNTQNKGTKLGLINYLSDKKPWERNKYSTFSASEFESDTSDKIFLQAIVSRYRKVFSIEGERIEEWIFESSKDEGGFLPEEIEVIEVLIYGEDPRRGAQEIIENVLFDVTEGFKNRIIIEDNISQLFYLNSKFSENILIKESLLLREGEGRSLSITDTLFRAHSVLIERSFHNSISKFQNQQYFPIKEELLSDTVYCSSVTEVDFKGSFSLNYKEESFNIDQEQNENIEDNNIAFWVESAKLNQNYPQAGWTYQFENLNREKMLNLTYLLHQHLLGRNCQSWNFINLLKLYDIDTAVSGLELDELNRERAAKVAKLFIKKLRTLLTADRELLSFPREIFNQNLKEVLSFYKGKALGSNNPKVSINEVGYFFEKNADGSENSFTSYFQSDNFSPLMLDGLRSSEGFPPQEVYNFDFKDYIASEVFLYSLFKDVLLQHCGGPNFPKKINFAVYNELFLISNERVSDFIAANIKQLSDKKNKSIQLQLIQKETRKEDNRDQERKLVNLNKEIIDNRQFKENLILSPLKVLQEVTSSMEERMLTKETGIRNQELKKKEQHFLKQKLKPGFYPSWLLPSYLREDRCPLIAETMWSPETNLRCYFRGRTFLKGKMISGIKILFTDNIPRLFREINLIKDSPDITFDPHLKNSPGTRENNNWILYSELDSETFKYNSSDQDEIIKKAIQMKEYLKSKELEGKVLILDSVIKNRGFLNTELGDRVFWKSNFNWTLNPVILLLHKDHSLLDLEKILIDKIDVKVKNSQSTGYIDENFYFVSREVFFEQDD